MLNIENYRILVASSIDLIDKTVMYICFPHDIIKSTKKGK